MSDTAALKAAWDDACYARAIHALDGCRRCFIGANPCPEGTRLAEVEKAAWLAYHQSRDLEMVP